jgi:acyl-CoA synthetase (AMP-forming)/AMP-acid ligase II
MTTLSSLISHHPKDAPAIGAPGRPWLSYGGLGDLARKVATALHDCNIGRGDRVAIVLPNGPEMATAFVTVMQSAVTAPLNPSYRQDEYEFYLKDLGAKAIILPHDYSGPALDAAKAVNLRILRAHSAADAKAGFFDLTPDSVGVTAVETDGWQCDKSPTKEDDVGLILHTSGTTSRPKIVPLLQSNLAASASNIMNTLVLTPADRCLNIMPLFHIHGLLAAVSASLAAGASVCCTGGFDALRFFSLIKDVKPSWYTAVPTMHQAILSRADRNKDIIADLNLRFLRSSSASLPSQVMHELVDVFNAPVIESYGMTEAAHQMASNPLPPRAQKPGAVGVEAGPFVRIANEAENELLGANAIGEVVISGDNVTPGYENNPAANEASFFIADGSRWFRTGDQGTFDSDGYLSLTGRLKEIINRGGEKVSPLEVDEVLMDHPAIAQVVTFAMPHAKLGEEVACALVLKSEEETTAQDIRAFAATRMADFKVPRKVVILDEIPKGATGKMQRIGLAEKLGLVE